MFVAIIEAQVPKNQLPGQKTTPVTPTKPTTNPAAGGQKAINPLMVGPGGQMPTGHGPFGLYGPFGPFGPFGIGGGSASVRSLNGVPNADIRAMVINSILANLINGGLGLPPAPIPI